MDAVTIYKVTCTKAYQMSEQGTGYSLQPWGNNTAYYEGHDDGGRLYDLPEGYTVETLQDYTTTCKAFGLAFDRGARRYCFNGKKLAPRKAYDTLPEAGFLVAVRPGMLD